MDSDEEKGCTYGIEINLTEAEKKDLDDFVERFCIDRNNFIKRQIMTPVYNAINRAKAAARRKV